MSTDVPQDMTGEDLEELLAALKASDDAGQEAELSSALVSTEVHFEKLVAATEAAAPAEPTLDDFKVPGLVSKPTAPEADSALAAQLQASIEAVEKTKAKRARKTKETESAPAVPDENQSTLIVSALPTQVSLAPTITVSPAPEPEVPVLDMTKDIVLPAQLNQFIDVDQYIKDTTLTDGNLQGCMLNQTGLRAHYATLAARAAAQYNSMKARFEVMEAGLYNKHRQRLSLQNEKVTERMVETAVKLDPAYLTGKGLVIEAESIADIVKGRAAAFEDRRNMLMQLGADKREEMKGAPRIMAHPDEDPVAARARAAAGQAISNNPMNGH
jgi:hypothetical protein